MQYIQKNTNIPPYDPMPRFLREISLKKSVSAAKELYAFLLGRAMLSKSNDWIDEDGNVYIKCTVEHMAQEMGKTPQTIATALNSLEEVDLIERRSAEKGRANIIYVKVKESLPYDSVSSNNLDNNTKENLSNNIKKPLGVSSRKLDTNKIDINNNTEKININKKQRMTI